MLLGLGIAVWLGNKLGTAPPPATSAKLDWGTLNWPSLPPSPADIDRSNPVSLPPTIPEAASAEPDFETVQPPLPNPTLSSVIPGATGLIFSSDHMPASGLLEGIRFVDVNKLIGSQKTKVSQADLTRLEAAIAAVVKDTSVIAVLDSSAHAELRPQMFPFVSPALDLTDEVQAKLSALTGQAQASSTNSTQ